jgi:hypothetical protein
MSKLYNQKHTGFTIKNKEKMRNFIHYLTPSIVSKTLSSCLILLMLAPIDISAQTREEGPWWPHPQWGAKDQAGASNWITDTKVLRAVKLVTTGKVYELVERYTSLVMSIHLTCHCGARGHFRWSHLIHINS